MKLPALPSDESIRLNELRKYQIIDSHREEEFNLLVELAARICETPIASISLIDTNRQWIKAGLGMLEHETDRNISFCAHAILHNDLFVVSDTHQDDRFADNPLVINAPSIRFYAGAQLQSDNGHNLGALCVIDTKPRELSWQQASGLKILSRQVSRLMELRYLKLNKSTVGGVGNKPSQNENLIRSQANHYASVHSKLLEPLKTGHFTRKELNRIHEQCAALEKLNKAFIRLVELHDVAHSTEATPGSQTLELCKLFGQLAMVKNHDQKEKIIEIENEFFPISNGNPHWVSQYLEILIDGLTSSEGSCLNFRSDRSVSGSEARIQITRNIRKVGVAVNDAVSVQEDFFIDLLQISGLAGGMETEIQREFNTKEIIINIVFNK